MNKFTVFLATCVILFTSVCIAGAKAVINGPQNVNLGDLVILDASRSEGLAFEWVLTNSDKTFLPVDNGTKLVFASGTPGKYIFVLVVGGEDNNKKLIVSTAQHTVVVGNDPNPPSPNPPNPPAPVKLPDGQFKVSQSVYDWAKTTNDKTNALLMSGNFESVAAMVAAGAFTGDDAIQNVVKSTVDANRNTVGGEGNSAYEVWKDKFFANLQIKLNELADQNLKTLADHETCWREIALGLRAYGSSQ